MWESTKNSNVCLIKPWWKCPSWRRGPASSTWLQRRTSTFRFPVLSMASLTQKVDMIFMTCCSKSLINGIPLHKKLDVTFYEMLFQVESSENGSRTVVKGSTALPPCSGGSLLFFLLFLVGFFVSSSFGLVWTTFPFPPSMGSPTQNNNNITFRNWSNTPFQSIYIFWYKKCTWFMFR